MNHQDQSTIDQSLASSIQAATGVINDLIGLLQAAGQSPEVLPPISEPEPTTKRPPGFAIIPAHYLRNGEFLGSVTHEMKVFLQILQHSGGGQHLSWPSTRRLQATTGIPDSSSVRRALRGLVAKGWIEQVPGPPGRTARTWRVLVPGWMPPGGGEDGLCPSKRTACVPPPIRDQSEETTTGQGIQVQQSIKNSSTENVVVFSEITKTESEPQAPSLTQPVEPKPEPVTTQVPAPSLTQPVEPKPEPVTTQVPAPSLTQPVEPKPEPVVVTQTVKNESVESPISEPTIHPSLSEQDDSAIRRMLKRLSTTQAKEVTDELCARLNGTGEPIRNPPGFVSKLVGAVLAGLFSPSASRIDQEKKRQQEASESRKKAEAEAEKQKVEQIEKERREAEALLDSLSATELEEHRTRFIEGLRTSDEFNYCRLKQKGFKGSGFNVMFRMYLRTTASTVTGDE